MVTVTLYLYASENVSSSVIENIEFSVGTDLDSQVDFTIDVVVQTTNYPGTKASLNRDMALDEFEKHVGENKGFTEKDHYMLLADTSYGGLERYDIGSRTAQQYSPYTYAVSVIGTGVPEEEYSCLAIHEFCHGVMSPYYSSCPEPDTSSHSCGEIRLSNSASPMLVYTVPDAIDNNWEICSGDLTDHDGGYATICSDCTLSKIDEYVTYNV